MCGPWLTLDHVACFKFQPSPNCCWLILCLFPYFLCPTETVANHHTSHNVQKQTSWIDELVDTPEGAFKRSSGHRRSASESMVFLDSNTNFPKVADENIMEEEDFDSQSAASMHSRGGSLDFDRYSKKAFSGDYLIVGGESGDNQLWSREICCCHNQWIYSSLFSWSYLVLDDPCIYFLVPLHSTTTACIRKLHLQCTVVVFFPCESGLS